MNCAECTRLSDQYERLERVRYGGMKEASRGLAQSHYGFSNDGEEILSTRKDRLEAGTRLPISCHAVWPERGYPLLRGVTGDDR
jgi:hypothetical protein